MSAPAITQERLASLDPNECADLIDYRIEHGILYDESDEGLALILARSSYDTKFFGQCFMRESYDDAMTYQHDDYWECMDDEEAAFTGYCGWRGFGKSVGTKTKLVKGICFRQQPFSLLVGKTHDFAAGETEGAKTELIVNARIRYFFGSMKATSYEGLDQQFSRKAWFASDPISGEPIAFVCPKGVGQQVRGINVRIRGKFRRPTMIFIDDLEDKDLINSEEYRQKTWAWLSADLLPCPDQRKKPNPHTNRWKEEPDNPQWTPPWRIWYQDTFKHEDSAMAKILNSTQWKTRLWGQSAARDTGEKDPRSGDPIQEYYSLIPDLISDETVRAEVKHAIEGGNLDEYAMEKMCLAVAPGHMSWTKEGYQYYHEDLEKKIQKDDGYDRFIIVDPAKTANPRSAYTAILAVACNVTTGKIFIRKLINERLSSREIVEKSFELCVATNSTMMGIEDKGLEDWIRHQYKNERSSNKDYHRIRFIWLEARGSGAEGDFGTGREAIKRARAAKILFYYEKKVVWHHASIKGSPLEQQQLSYPKPKWWDALDCAGYIPKVLEELGRYFAEVDAMPDDEYKDPWPVPNQRVETGNRIRNREWAILN